MQIFVCFYFKKKSFLFSERKALHNVSPDLSMAKAHCFKLRACAMHLRTEVTSWPYWEQQTCMELVLHFTGERIWTSLICKVALLMAVKV